MKSIRLLTLCLLAWLAGLGAAEAGEKIKCDLLTIEAARGGGGVDKSLEAYRGIFANPPFSAFDTFRLVGRTDYLLELGTPRALILPAGLGGSLRFNRVDDGRFDLTLSLTRDKALPIEITARAAPGRPFFAAGFSRGDKTLVFGVLCDRDGNVPR